MLLFDRIASNRALLALAALCFLQLPLLLRGWAAANGADWAIQPPLFMTDTTMPVLTGGDFADVVQVNAVHGQAMKWSFYAETGRLMQILGMFIVGLVLGRVGFFRYPDRFRRGRRIALALSVAAALLFWAWGPQVLNAIAAPESAARPHLQWALDCWLNLAILSVQVLLFVELFQTAGRPLLETLAPAGRMTLSLYVAQSIIFVPIFYGFGLDLHEDLTLAQSLWIGLVAFAAQMLLAHWWFRHFRYGPLEWLWRAATRTRLDIPFRKQTAGLRPAPGSVAL
jgi:uncharacterized protein